MTKIPEALATMCQHKHASLVRNKKIQQEQLLMQKRYVEEIANDLMQTDLALVEISDFMLLNGIEFND